jgi:hypothetical protein
LVFVFVFAAAGEDVAEGGGDEGFECVGGFGGGVGEGVGGGEAEGVVEEAGEAGEVKFDGEG